MSLDKRTRLERIEIVGEWNFLQCLEVTEILENDVVISSSNHRYVVYPGSDTSNLDPKVVAVANLLHTPDLVEEYKKLTEQSPEQPPE